MLAREAAAREERNSSKTRKKVHHDMNEAFRLWLACCLLVFGDIAGFLFRVRVCSL
jgi:hypothetical protein